MERTYFRALFLLVALAAPPAAAAPLPTCQVAKDRIGALVQEADKQSLAEAWACLRKIQELGLPEDATLAALQAAAGEVGPVGKLIVARGLLDLGEDGLYGAKAVELATPILEAGSPEHRRAAAEILGDDSLTGRARRRGAEALDKVVGDDTADPALRLVTAKALYRVGNVDEKTQARKLLLGYLTSTDRALRIHGALAIYEIGDGFQMGARAILEDIASEPTDEGRLARAYLDRERREKDFVRLEREVSRLLLEGGQRGQGTSGKGDDRLDLLRELLGLIDATHIEGKETPKEVLIERAARGMLRALDPFSSFLTSDQYKAFAFDLNRHYGGIGAFVRIDNGVFQITRPIYSGPAYKAGILSGDRILKIDGWETPDQELDEIISRLKGKPGTDVLVNVWRPGWPEPRDITLTRAEIEVPSVNDAILPGKIGYIELITFGANTSEELRAKLEEQKKEGARAVILDLRANSGGYLTQAQQVAELFLPKDKLIVYTKSRIEREERYYSRGDAVFPDLPLVVLVDDSTASASEIVSGALQDHKRAKVVGVQSYGKGSVQNLFPLNSRPGEPYVDENRNRRWDQWEQYTDENGNKQYDPGPRARLTIAYYYLPSGRCLHKIVDPDGKVENPDYGVIPDYKIEPTRLKTTELWKNAVIADLWSERVFQKYVDAHMEAQKVVWEKLAEDGDQGRTDLYPGFEEFYAGLNTQLSKDEVRRWLRAAVREKVADIRAKAWPGIRLIGDFEEDVQLQGAVKIALQMLGERIEDIAEYKSVLKLPKEFGRVAAK